MIWLCAWLSLAVIGIPVLYVGYGFVMSAIRARDSGNSPPHVVKVDSVIATAFTLLDGVLNVLVFPVLCLDFRLSMMFRMTTVKGFSFPWMELITERLSRYNENPTERLYRRAVAQIFSPFLDAKDPKGWHIRPSPKP